MLSNALLESFLVETICFGLIFAVLLLWKRPQRSAAKGEDRTVQSTSSVYRGSAKAYGSPAKTRKSELFTTACRDLSDDSTDTGRGSLRSSDTDTSPEASSDHCFGPQPTRYNRPQIQSQGPMATPFQHDARRDTRQNCPHNNLAKVMSKLSPQDAATVMASLSAASSPKGVPVVLYPHPVPMLPGKQWVPFQGNGQSQHTSHPQKKAKEPKEAVQEPRMPFRKNQPPPGMNMEPYANTLSKNLRELETLDPKTVIFVRKISKLGLNSPQLLEIYFSQFGPVRKMFVSHGIEPPQGKRTHPRWRPATMGFVAMERSEDADKAKDRGAEQVVLGETIQVLEFECRKAERDNDESAQVEEVEEEGDDEDVADIKELEDDFVFCPITSIGR